MRRRGFIVVCLFILVTGPVIAQPVAPALSSRPGAAYTLYLNFTGFNYPGTWAGATPGNVPPYSADADTSTFSATDIAHIREIWARAAEKFTILNVNVTTVDPAPAGSTFLQRRQFYDQQARMVHTVIGGNNAWLGGGGGVSYINTAQFGNVFAGGHTNWVFPRNLPSGGSSPSPKFVALATAHEQGHAAALQHQGYFSGGTYQPYDPGNASVGPIMGAPYNSARELWRIGPSGESAPPPTQNDLAVLRSNAGIGSTGAGGFMDSGIGHSLSAATALPLIGTAIDFNLAKGFITPISATPIASGEANYTRDFFRLEVPAVGAALTVNLISGASRLTPGVADPGATLDATLRLLDAAGSTLFESRTTALSEMISTNNLASGTYYIQVSSAGASTTYFDVGSYFLTGTFVPVPEPTLILAFAVVGLGGVRAARNRVKSRRA